MAGDEHPDQELAAFILRAISKGKTDQDMYSHPAPMAGTADMPAKKVGIYYSTPAKL